MLLVVINLNRIYLSLMMQVALLEEQKSEAAENEGSEKVEDGAKPNDADPTAVERTRKGEILDEKPDINDVPIEESQVKFNSFFSLVLLSRFSLDGDNYGWLALIYTSPIYRVIKGHTFLQLN